MSLVDLDPSLSAPGVHNVLRMLEAVLPIDSSARSTDQRTKLSVRPEGCGGVEADVVLHVPLRGRQTCGSVRNEALWFSDDPSVPWPYRGRKLTLPAIQAHPLQPRADESVLMWRNREALWTVSGSDKQTVFRTAFPLPSLGEGGSLSEPLDPQRMPSTLPLVHSFHHAYAEELYANPPLRASFVFDDPNLHWPSYGRVNYKEIAARAESLGYHVGFATIPLDAWVTHQATAALFRAKADRLSLVVHEIGRAHV